MQEKRSLFSKIFGKQSTGPSNATVMKMLNGHVPVFTDFGSNAYDSDIVRSAVDAIARNTAKLKGRHIRRIDGRVQNVQSNLDYLLSVRPNQFMDAYTCWYRVATQYFMKNNAFIFVDTDSMGNILGFYPLNFSQVEFIETQKEVFCRFRFMGGEILTVPYANIIHLRRFYYRNDLFGEPNENAILPTLELINTTNEGIINAIKSSAFLRGLLKFQSMLKKEDMIAQRDAFVKDYLDVTNNGGIAATDAKADYIELKNDPKMVDAGHMALIQDKIYKYYGVSEAIVRSDYNEDQWNSFYSSVVEPFALQLSLEMTSKIFTERERGFGNEIVFSASRLLYASNQTKITISKELLPLGIFTINEIREIWEAEPVEGGDIRVQTLNVVNADKADEYQLGAKPKADSSETGGDMEDAEDDSEDDELSETGAGQNSQSVK